MSKRMGRIYRAAAAAALGFSLVAPALAQDVGGLFNRLRDTATGGANEQPVQAAAQAAALAANEQTLTLGGYAMSFSAVRDRLASGDYAGAIALFSGEAGGEGEALNAFVSTNDQFLRNAELGVMRFELGETAAAVEHFNLAEAEVNDADAAERRGGMRGALGRLGQRATRLGAGLVGREGLAPYQEADFEEILQLNYLTLTYLMEGEYKAFNVTRRAIVAQTIAREVFLEELAAAGKELEDLGTAEPASAGSIATAQTNFFNVFSQYDDIAARVPSAYVNPLGYYVNAVVLEIDSIRKPEKRGNARESYRKALELAPGSAVLERALADMQEAPAEDGMTTVHVIMAEGFAPSRQVLGYGLQLNDQVIPIELPVYTPNPSAIAQLTLAADTGQSGKMEPIADVEAIVMRSQKDRLPIIWAKVALQAVRSSLMQSAAGDSMIGAVAYGVAEGLQSPDTRSWSSLPARFHVARLKVPPTATAITVNAFSETGNRLGAQAIPIDTSSSHVVIYGRANDTHMGVRVSDQLWINP